MAAQTIECKAAVAWGPNRPLSLETVQVEAPRAGEVRIRMAFTSVCHTDQYTLSGLDQEAVWPCILGHEGAGVVESVGEGVASVSPGDHVVPLYIPQCRECEYCLHPKTNLCQRVRVLQGKGLMADGTSRFRARGEPVFHYMGTSTFSEYTVVPEIAVAKVAPDAALDRVCLLGCGVSTGFGAALNVANVAAGETAAVFGLGTVGLSAAVGCLHRKASRVIGVDTNPAKFEVARQFGLSEFVNPRDHPNTPIQDVLAGLTGGGLDHTFECIGNVDVMRAALESTHKGWGQSVIIGLAGAGQEVRTRPLQLICGRSWRGCAFGGWKSRDAVPELVRLYSAGILDVDKFITHRRQGLGSLNDVFELLKSGESLRCVVAVEGAA